MKKFYSNFSYLMTALCLVAFAQFGMTQTVDITYQGGAFNEEDGWELVNTVTNTVADCYSTADGTDPYNSSPTISYDQTYELRAWESFGDGWNGSTIEISFAGTPLYGPTSPFVSGNGSISCTGTPNGGGVVLTSFSIPAPACEITCPGDIFASTDADNCFATVDIPLPTVTEDCGSIAVVEDIEGPAVPLNFNFTGLITTPFTIPGVPTTLPAGVTSVDVLVVALGDFGGQTFENPNVIGEDGTILGDYNSGATGDCADYPGEVFTLTSAQYLAWAADGTLSFTLATDPDVDQICATETVQGTAFIPVGTLAYVNDYNFTEDASDVYPVGTTTVTFTTEDAQGGFPVSCSFDVTVEDLVAPVLDCPGDQTISLDAGECAAVFSYSVTGSDNCPVNINAQGWGPFGDPNTGCLGSGATLGSNFGASEQIQYHDMVAEGVPNGAMITQACFVYDQAAWGNTMANISYYTQPAGNYNGFPDPMPNYQTATPAVETGLINVPNNGGVNGQVVCIDLPTPLTYDNSLDYFMGVYSPVNGNLSHNIGPSETCNGLTSNGNFTVYNDDFGNTNNYYSAIGFAYDALTGFTYLVDVAPVPDPGNVDFGTEVFAGNVVSGSAYLEIGEYCFTYTLTDLAGNVGECTWCVTVEEFPEELQSTTLGCNDNVNVSLGPDCIAEINADFILEGGLYGCYEDYLLEIVGLPSGAVDGNGTPVLLIDGTQIPEFVATGMAGPFEVKVIDPDNGNNYCWGTIMLEDKLAPEFECDNDVTIACTTSLEPTDQQETGAASFADATVVQIDPGAANTVESAPITVTGLPDGAVLTDINIDVNLEHTWVSDLTITLVSPNGTVELVSGACGTADDIDATFDDEGSGIVCGNMPAISGNVIPNEPLSSLNDLSANGEYYLIIEDAFGGDGGPFNSWGIELEWIIYTPSMPQIISTECSAETVEYSDEELLDPNDCTNEFAQIIERTWTAVDAKGNAAVPCVQTIYITRETLASLSTPPNYDNLPGNEPMLACDGGGVVWNTVVSTNGAIVPSPWDNGFPVGSPGYLFGTGVPGGVGECGTIDYTYTDVIIPLCDQTCDISESSYKVLRNWTIVDWCTGEIIEYPQIIKVFDGVGPTVNSLSFVNGGQTLTVENGGEISISTDVWGCGAIMENLQVDGVDNCSNEIQIEYQDGDGYSVVYNPAFNKQWFEAIFDDPAKCSTIEFVLEVSDCCGNTTEATFTINIEDRIPPVIVAETYRTVTLSTDGVAKIYAESFDDGSHDGCGDIGFAVKRMDNGGSCEGIDKYPPFGDDNTQFNEMVHFCCDDAIPGESVMIQFMVCDDADCDGIFEFSLNPNNDDNCNVAMVEVEVQDKLAPVVLCPDDATVNCIDVAGIDWENDDLVDNLFGAPQAAGTCDVELTRSVVQQLDCPDGFGNLGFVIRTFTATNAAGTSTCQQVLTVTGDETSTLTCDRISLDIEHPLFDQLTTSMAREFWFDDPTQPDPFPCFDSHWCEQNGSPQINPFTGLTCPTDIIPSFDAECDAALDYPDVLLDIDGLCTEAGISVTPDTFLFANGACKKYLVHYEVIDNCVFDENFVNPTTGEIDPYHSDNGYYELYIEINAFDDEGPVLDCSPVSIAANECDGLTEGAITLSGEDNCTPQEEWGFQWRLDAGADGTIDYPEDGGWYLDSEASLDVINNDPDVINQLPYFPVGDHVFYWVVSDGCGNTSSCFQEVTITNNEKQPTPYCYDGLATAVMPANGEVELWASDFDAGSFDNCPGDLIFTMIPEVDAANSTNPYADSELGWLFDCSYIENGVSQVLEVRIYVTDADGNFDYCTASLRIDDNFDACPNAGTITYEVDGKIATEANDGVSGVEVTVDADYPEFPMIEMTDSEGNYSFADDNGVGYLYANVDYTVTPEHDIDYLNGVTTLDIVKIQKHILELEELDSPYKLIAADVNNDCTVSGSDLVQIRKLILGLYENDDLPYNTSWRFVDSEFVFTNPESPCNFAEFTDIFNMSEDETDNFVAVKVGDVNASAAGNINSANVESRSNGVLNFVVTEQELNAGETYTIDFLAKDFVNVYGYQYTIELSNAQYVAMTPGALNVTEANFGLARANDGIITTSFDAAKSGATIANDEVLFSIEVRANADTRMSDVVTISSRKTVAEAYIGATLEINDANIEFRTDNGDVSGERFALHQNEPNPFNGVTTIRFELPSASEYTLTVLDVTGKVLYTRTEDGFAGNNTVKINSNQLSATGVLYYKLENNDNVATKKMIIIE